MGEDPREDPGHDLTDEDEAFQDALGDDGQSFACPLPMLLLGYMQFVTILAHC